MSLQGFLFKSSVPKGGRKLAVLRLHHGANPESAVEATVDLHCETVCFNQLFGDVNIFSLVLSEKFSIVFIYSLRSMVLPFFL